ncbi:MAG: hypothetical protein Q9203_002265 [Teloschistes exilis]
MSHAHHQQQLHPSQTTEDGILEPHNGLATGNPRSKSAVLHRDLHKAPRHVVEASGLYLVLSDKRRIIDASGGAAVSCIGHGDERVRDAMVAQVTELDYCHSLFFSCPSSEALCRWLVDSTEGQMAKAFIVNSAKLARQYFLELPVPEPQRIRFIARDASYHGNTLGALSISGHKARRSIYEPMLAPNTLHVSACNSYRAMKEHESFEAFVARLAEELDREFQKAGPETVCAFVAEPVVGAALGCVPSVPGYFKAMKSVCDKYGALVILDEVMCGMGRTGTLHAWQQEGIIPDIQVIGKGLGGGYVPIAGFLAEHRLINVLDGGTGQFTHGQTYQAHPMVCAAALKVQNIVQTDDLVANVSRMGRILETKLKDAFSSHPNVGNIRGRGLFWGLEFVANKTTKEPFPSKLAVAMSIHEEGIRQDPGIMLYPGVGSVDGWTGDHVIIAPPYNVTVEDIEIIVRATRMAVVSYGMYGGQTFGSLYTPHLFSLPLNLTHNAPGNIVNPVRIPFANCPASCTSMSNFRISFASVVRRFIMATDLPMQL